MAVTVSKQFSTNFEIVAARWLEEGDTPEQIAELKAAIRADLADGEGFFRDGEHKIISADERRKLWDDYFKAEADEFRAARGRAMELAKGINARIVNFNLSNKEKTK